MKTLVFSYVVYPYLCLAIMACGLVLRYIYAPEQWNARSSQLLEQRFLRVGAPLFHVGILLSFGGHIIGLVLPDAVLRFFGISMHAHALAASLAGKIIAPVVIVGLAILLYRRLSDKRVAATSSIADVLILLLIGINACTGFYQAYFAHYPVFSTVGPWLRTVLSLAPAPGLMVNVPSFLQLHIMSGFTIFALLPFTRLVHIFSVPVTWLRFPKTIYRKRYGDI